MQAESTPGRQQNGPRLPLTTKLYYGSGSIAEGTHNVAFSAFLLFYFNQVLGLSGTLSGAAIFIALCVDAITDPLMGSISDNFHSRWGRRHPFMYASALPMAICFYLLFNPPGLGEVGLFLWLTFFAIGVRVSMTLYSIPSNSMVAELTTDYVERTSLVAYRYLFGWLGALAIAQIGYLHYFAPSQDYSDGRLDPAAYGAFALVGALVIFSSILICSAGTHRLIPTLRSPPEPTPLTARRFIGELRGALSNRSYVMLLIAALFAAVAGGFSDVVGLYMNTYFWEFSTSEIAVLVAGLVLSVMLAFAITPALTSRFDKKKVAVVFASFGVSFGPLPVFLRLLGWMPENGDPMLLPIIVIHGVLLVTAVIAIGILISSMIADAIDEAELSTGKRQEGMFVSAIAFSAKATSGIGGFFAGLALDLIDFPTQAQPGSVSPEKVFNLGLAVGPGLLLFYLLMLYFISGYRITRERHGEILSELERRRIAAEDPTDRGANV
jgi:Na+/melibiose symporter-like transporter